MSEEKETLSLAVYRQLREAIVQGEFRPNERLVEAELAERLEASRTPVRDALQRLTAEGLVATRRRGWIVHEHSSEEIREIYEVRAAVEGFAAFLAATRANEEQLQTFKRIQEESIEAADSDPGALVELNDGFHEALIGAAGNTRLTQLTRRSREHFFNYRIASLYSDEESKRAIEGHRQIMEALASQDANAAQDATREHILEALAVTLSKVR